MNKQISVEVFEILEELSNPDLQVKLWLNIENEGGLISSFTELLNDVDGPDFNYVASNLIEDSDLKKELFILLEKIKNYKEPTSYKKYKNDVFIISDPNWKTIRDYTKEIKENMIFPSKDLRKNI